MHYRLNIDLVEVHPQDPETVQTMEGGALETLGLVPRERNVRVLSVQTNSDDLAIIAGFLQAAADATANRSE